MSRHDAFIWANCGLGHQLDIQRLDFILGDGSYPLKPKLLTPVLSWASRAEQRYNTSHKKTRCCVEKCIGILKSRFLCLHKSGGTMQFSPVLCSKIAIAAAILHNICMN